jgi:hypothetical protein
VKKVLAGLALGAILIVGALNECTNTVTGPSPSPIQAPAALPSPTWTPTPVDSIQWPPPACLDIRKYNKLVKKENAAADASFEADTYREFVQVRRARMNIWERVAPLFKGLGRVYILAKRNVIATRSAYFALVVLDYSGDTHWTRVANRLDERINELVRGVKTC